MSGALPHIRGCVTCAAAEKEVGGSLLLSAAIK